MRVALYARFSSDRQNGKSATDQLAALEREVARRPGWTIVASYKDEAISGETLSTRPGMLALLADAAERRFDVLLAEDLDRIARDQESNAHIRKRLTFAGIVIETQTQGRLVGQVGAVQSAIAGAMSEIFIDQLRHKTRRGLEERVRAGFSAGGLCYGYRIASKGVFEVVEAEAAIVRRIFDDYGARRLPPRAIAHALNAEGVPGPRGGAWSPTTISGDRRAGDGILCQELYVGVRVFNRRTYRKHPDTGARSSRLNPPEEWVRMRAASLRIVSDEQWAAVQGRQRQLSELPARYARRPKRLLSGLLRCALCEGPMTLNGPRYECARRRERGACTNRKVIAAQVIERRVIDGVRKHLLSPRLIAAAAKEYQRDMEVARRAAVANRLPLERELAEVGRRIERATESYLSGGIEMAEFHAALEPLKARRAAVQAQLDQAAGGPDVVQLHPGAVEVYRQLAEGLHDALAADDADEVREACRDLIERVDFHPLEGFGKFDLTVHGQLARVLQVTKTKNPTADDCGVSMGAGARSVRNPTSLPVTFAA